MENNLKNQILQKKEVKLGNIFFLVFGLLIAGSVFATYYRTMIQKNYIIKTQADCNPAEKACFVWKCDPASEVEGEKCTGNPENDIFYYSLAKRNASKIPLCDPVTDKTCTPMLCDPETEKNCEKVFCDEKTKLEQEVECNDPQEYLKNTQLEKENEE